ncbi:hypothetical protein DFH09DRAFT_1075839 [Mycena vulgaris]|nr:hypothetical protein DFH09DRAFT_1075839 [Mycena vulgaris]
MPPPVVYSVRFIPSRGKEWIYRYAAVDMFQMPNPIEMHLKRGADLHNILWILLLGQCGGISGESSLFGLPNGLAPAPTGLFGLGLEFGCRSKPKPGRSACKPVCRLGKPVCSLSRETGLRVFLTILGLMCQSEDFAAALLLPHAAAIGSLRQPNTSKCLQRQFSRIAAAIFDFAAAIFMHAAAVVLIVCGSLKVVCGNLGVTPRHCDIAAAIIQPCNGSRASGQRSLVGSNRSLDKTSLPVGTPREWSLITLRGALGPSTPTAFAVAFNGSRKCNARNWGNTYFRPTYLLPSELISSRRQISPQRRLHAGSSSSAPRQSNS